MLQRGRRLEPEALKYCGDSSFKGLILQEPACRLPQRKVHASKAARGEGGVVLAPWQHSSRRAGFPSGLETSYGVWGLHWPAKGNVIDTGYSEAEQGTEGRKAQVRCRATEFIDEADVM